MNFHPQIRKAADLLRLLAGQDSSGVGLPLRTDAAGRLEVVSYRSVHACRIYNDAAISHTSSGNWQFLTFNSESLDSDTMHDPSVNPGQITFVHAGVYLVGGAIEFAAHATGARGIAIRLDGATYIASQLVPTANLAQTVSVAALHYFAAGQYIELAGLQSSGGALGMNRSADYSPLFWAAML
jgi:hypothetical protein